MRSFEIYNQKAADYSALFSDRSFGCWCGGFFSLMFNLYTSRFPVSIPGYVHQYSRTSPSYESEYPIDSLSGILLKATRTRHVVHIRYPVRYREFFT